MKINTFQSIATLIAICFLSFGMISGSNAEFEITESPSDSDTYLYGGATYDSFSVKTSEPYYTVNWSIGGVQVYSSSGDGTTTSANYFPYDTFAGDIEGITYQIDIEAWSWTEQDQLKDTATFYLTVYEPINTFTPIDDHDLSFVSGYIEISSQTYDYDSGYMSFGYLVYAYHSGVEADGNVSITTEYKASFPDLDIENKDWRPNRESIEPNSVFIDPDSPPWSKGSHGMTLEFGEEGKPYDGEAYVRLVVDGKDGIDNYHLTNKISCLHR